MAPAVAAANSASALVIPRWLPALWATCAAASEIFTVGCSLEKGNKKTPRCFGDVFSSQIFEKKTIKRWFLGFRKTEKKRPQNVGRFPAVLLSLALWNFKILASRAQWMSKQSNGMHSNFLLRVYLYIELYICRDIYIYRYTCIH